MAQVHARGYTREQPVHTPTSTDYWYKYAPHVCQATDARQIMQKPQLAAVANHKPSTSSKCTSQVRCTGMLSKRHDHEATRGGRAGKLQGSENLRNHVLIYLYRYISAASQNVHLPSIFRFH